jgi:hypothetical protein
MATLGLLVSTIRLNLQFKIWAPHIRDILKYFLCFKVHVSIGAFY